MVRTRNRSTLVRVVFPALAIVVVGLLAGWILLVWIKPADGPTAKQSACSLPKVAVTRQDLQCHPEANLFYPGSTVFERLGASQTTAAFEGTNPAFSGAILISADPVTKIYAWYDSWLKQRNWYRSPLLGAGYVSAHGYARVGGREAFGVDIDDPARLSATIGQKVPSGGTIFEIRYIVFPYRAGATPAPSCAPTPEPSGLLSSFYCNP